MKHRLSLACAVVTTFALIAGNAVASPMSPTRQDHVADSRDAPPAVTRGLSQLTPGQLAAAIDSTWGQGLSTTRKLEIFDLFWAQVDQRFASFQGIGHVDWTSLRKHYRPIVAAGVSRGRFAAIMNYLSMALRDTHTNARDRTVNINTVPGPGIPLLWHGPWLKNTFGACTTALPDGSALILQVSPSHPLGLQSGDRVIGFEGHPWTDLLPRLFKAELPVYSASEMWGSTSDAFRHDWIASGPLNWHLFNTIDIVKHGTGAVQHLSTTPLDGQLSSPVCSEQLDIPGIAKPDLLGTNFSDAVSWGILRGTNIGFIYVWGWNSTSGAEFTQAVDELTQQHQTDGLILDFRFNLGGNMFASNAGLAMLFDHPTQTIGFALRDDPKNHFSMKLDPEGGPEFYVVDDPFDPRSYNKPIAVLTGPGAVSSGDQVALRMTFNPRARTFGKTTGTAFDAPESVNLDPEWLGSVATYESYRAGHPSNYLTHDKFLVDQPVWLTPDDVAAGKDTVVAAAVAWITNGK